MSGSQEFSTITIPDHLRWLADGDAVLIVDRQAERSWQLGGQAAVLWTRLPGTTSFNRLVEHWMQQYCESRATTETALWRYLNRWLEEGLLVPVKEQT